MILNKCTYFHKPKYALYICVWCVFMARLSKWLIFFNYCNQLLYINTLISYKLLIMSEVYVNVRFKVVWQFKEYPEYKVTRCKKIINVKTGTLLKYHTRGFFIKNKYLKRKEINKYLEKIPKTQYFNF